MMTSGPITSWQIDGDKVESVAYFIFSSSKITADGDCSHAIRIHLLFGSKALTNLDNVLKNRDITLLTKLCLVKALVFPVVMYGCKSWTIKKADHWRTDAFELWCWRRLMRVPESLDSQEIKSVNPKGNQPRIFMERLMLKLKASILCPPDVKSRLIGKDPDSGKGWGSEEKGSTEDEMIG